MNALKKHVECSPSLILYIHPSNQTTAMRLSSLIPRLRLIVAIISSNNHSNKYQQRRSNEGDVSASLTPSPLDLAARTGGFTDPLIPTHPTLFYETATAFHVISGITVFTTYTDLISGTVAIPFTGSTELDLSALPATTTTSAIATSLVFPVEPSIPPGSPTPTLDLGACSTAAGDGVQACANGLIASFDSVYGAKTTSSGRSADGGSSAGVAPTKTVTEPYLGAEVAKGEPTWPVGVQANGGLRGMGSVQRKVCSLFAVFGGWTVIRVIW